MITCPHCETKIDVVGATEASEILGISTTWGYKQRLVGKWPESISDQPQLWLRAEIEALAVVQDKARSGGVEAPAGKELVEELQAAVKRVRRGKQRDLAEEHLETIANEPTTRERRHQRTAQRDRVTA
jgi:hypothetical protein